jgi:hypothetical protein
MTATAPPFWPRFGLNWPSIPPPQPVRDCGPRAERKKRAKGPCPTCGGSIPDYSWACCMTCSSVAPAKEGIAHRHGHAVGSCPVDLRKGTPFEQKQAHERAVRLAKAKAVRDAKKPTLTAKERRGLMADARAGDQPLPIVKAFLASQVKP